MEPKNVELGFLGEKISFVSKEDPEIIAEVVDIATMKLMDAESRGKGVAPHKITMLALLDLAEEYVKSKRRYVDHRDEMIRKSNHLLDMIGDEMS